MKFAIEEVYLSGHRNGSFAAEIIAELMGNWRAAEFSRRPIHHLSICHTVWPTPWQYRKRQCPYFEPTPSRLGTVFSLERGGTGISATENRPHLRTKSGLYARTRVTARIRNLVHLPGLVWFQNSAFPALGHPLHHQPVLPARHTIH
jgi:hypothetical protein